MYQERELCFWDNKQPKNNFMTRVMGDQRRSATNPENGQLSKCGDCSNLLKCRVKKPLNAGVVDIQLLPKLTRPQLWYHINSKSWPDVINNLLLARLPK
jgi:hypothetical protein